MAYANPEFEARNLLLREHLSRCATCSDRSYMRDLCDAGFAHYRAVVVVYDEGPNMYARMKLGGGHWSGIYVGPRDDLQKERALLQEHVDEGLILAQFDSYKLGFLAQCWHEFDKTDFRIDCDLSPRGV